MNPIRFLSVCSGIEAVTVATARLGWTPVAYSEIEPFPCAVLKHHHPRTPNLGDMTKFHEWPELSIDLLAGGTPCQSFSVAGLRKGLADPRGNLALTYLAILDRYRPRWCLWENVPGVHSSWTDVATHPATGEAFDPIDDAVAACRAAGLDLGASVGSGDFEEADQSSDFDCFLSALEQLGYGVATTVLDAQYFGLAQRRERVFVVGHLGDWRPAAAVLLEPESLRWDPPPSRKAGQRTAGTVTPSALGGSSPCGGDGREGMLISGTLSSVHNVRADQAWGGQLLPEVAWALQERDSKGSDSKGSDSKGSDSKGSDSSTKDGHLIPVAFDCKRGSEAGELSPTLRSMGHDGSHANAGGQVAVALPINDAATRHAGTNGSGADVGKGHGMGVGQPGDPMFTLTKGDKHAVAVGFEPRVASGRRAGVIGDTTGDLTKEADRGDGHPCVATRMAVRRLTPRECERLQGFPDDYTRIPYNGRLAEKCPDGPRYKALGNSMPVPVITYIADRISIVHAALAQ